MANTTDEANPTVPLTSPHKPKAMKAGKIFGARLIKPYIILLENNANIPEISINAQKVSPIILITFRFVYGQTLLSGWTLPMSFEVEIFFIHILAFTSVSSAGLQTNVPLAEINSWSRFV